MTPLRIALVTPDAEVLDDPNRGVLWELVGTDENPDYALTISDGVEEAILRGERETRAALYDLRRGALLLLGPRYPLAPMALDAREREDAEFLYAYAELHRKWVRATCYREMLTRAFELLAGGTMQIINKVAWIDGAPGPCRMGEAPAECHEPETMVTRGIPRSCPFISS
jgi:hypothetical protein